MVTFRFYLVSIVAFFLALAVGVVVGSVLDEGISTSLQDRLEGVEQNLNDTVASIDDKNREIDALQQYAEASVPFAVQDRLTGTSTVLVAEPGLEAAPVEDLVLRLRQAGSHVSGIVFLDDRWSLTEEGDRSRFAAIVDRAGQSVDQLHRSAWDELLSANLPGSSDPATTEPDATVAPDGSTATTVPATTVPADPGAAVAVFEDTVLTRLEDEGFLRLVRVDGEDPLGGAELLVVAVTGTGSTLAESGSAATELATQSAALAFPTVLSEIYVDDSVDDEDPPERGTIVRSATEDAAVRFSTVDDLDLVAGRVASVLALADLRNGLVGRFGYGPEVDGVLPRWSGP